MTALIVLVLAVLAYYFIIFVNSIENSVTTLFFAIIIMLLKLHPAHTSATNPELFPMNMENLSHIVDFNTLGLLLGMMIIVGFLKKSGFFQYMIINILRISKGNFHRMLLLLMIIVALTSAFLDNVITIMMTLPMIFLIADTMEVNPAPFVFMTIFIDNVGGMATLIGSPLNLVLGSVSGKSFNEFILNTGVFSIIAFIVIYLLSKKMIKLSSESLSKIKGLLEMDPEKAIADRKMMKVSTTIFLLVVAGFVMHSFSEIELSYISLLGALTLLFIFRKSFEKVSEDIDWDTLFFYMGLYIISYSLEEIGVIEAVAKAASPLASHPIIAFLGILWISALAIPFLSAVPGTLILAPVLKYLIGYGFSQNIWWAYALGANLGTNLTPLGAVQNLIGVSMLEKQTGKKVTFGEFMKIGFKVTIPSLIIASIWGLVIYH
ncbi:MAG: anion permease [Thermotogaceae bacterium]|nr:anion permease [Thermotogaceae bacterium]